MADAGMATSLMLTERCCTTCGRFLISQATSLERLGAGASASAPAGVHWMPSGLMLTSSASMPRGARGVALAAALASTGSGLQSGGQGYT